MIKTTLKWTFKLLFLALVGLSLGAFIYAYQTLPQTTGEVKITSPALKAPVKITRDSAGIPHIEAQNRFDTAFAVGYVQAQDRLWQLEFNRRVVNGTLSETLGKATLGTDRFIRTLGVKEAAKAQYALLDDVSKQELIAYAAGINASRANAASLPIEFHLTSTKPQEWQPEDTMGWLIMMALDLGGNYGTELLRLSLARDFSSEEIWKFLPPYSGENIPQTLDFSKTYRELGVYNSKKAALEPLNHPYHGFNEGVGSNSWVLSGEKTMSGKPLLANDPHLGLSAPAIWYFVHVKTPEMNVIGATLPGGPQVILGRNDKIAWGFTNINPDVQDLYLEQLNPAKADEYRVPNGFSAFTSRKEVIKVKGEADVELNVQSTRNGPVMTQVLEGASSLIDTSRFALSLKWTALSPNNTSYVAASRLVTSQNVDEAKAALSLFIAPMQNVVVASVSGDIAYIPAGKVVLRKPEHDLRGIAPALGWEDKYQWAGYLEDSLLPHLKNPASHQVITANQRIHAADYPHLISNDWTLPYRYDRIEALLAQKPKHSMETMRDAQADVVSLAAQRLLPFFKKAAAASSLTSDEKVLAANFNGEMKADSLMPLIFSSFIDELTQKIIVAKLGENRASVYGRRDFRQALEGALERNDAFFCGEPGCESFLTPSLTAALNTLTTLYGADKSKWNWGQAHAARSEHRPFGKVNALARFFNVVEPTGGDTYTVNVGRLELGNRKAPFSNVHAASLRTIFDLSNLENSRFIYQTGQSGNVFSSHYRDFSKTWGKVEYLPLSFKIEGKGEELLLVK
jgi:penicillin G amidase